MKITYNNTEVNMPDTIIVGAAKSGTTSLFNYLTNHPDIFSPKEKEPWFFSFKDEYPNFVHPVTGSKNPKMIISNINDYLELFKNAGNQHCIEGSTAYLYTAEKTIKNIREIYGELYKKLNIIIILRNPIERAWSHYTMHLRDNQTNLSFENSIKKKTIETRLAQRATIGYDYIGFGRYYKQVKIFKETFNRVKVILYDEFCSQPQSSISSIFSFIGLKDYEVNIKSRFNISGIPKNKAMNYASRFIKKPSMFKDLFMKIFPKSLIVYLRNKLNNLLYKRKKLPPQIRESLINQYKDEIYLLEKLINRDLRNWLKN